MGQELTYTVGVQNAGPSSATSVSLSDTLPAGVSVRLGHSLAGQLLAVGGHGHLPARHDRERRQRERPDQGHAAGHRRRSRNSASATSSVNDPNSANNSASAATTVNPAADLSLTKSDSPDPVLQGQQLTYTLSVHNTGPVERHRRDRSPTRCRPG